MKIETFEPKIDTTHKFAVAVPVEGGDVCIIETYATREALAVAFDGWSNFATERCITQPCPIEIIDKEMRCKVLTNILEGS